MADRYDIADSTDWLNTPLSGLAPLENALHCQICKEFFDTPMITSCCHTFCSRCIRVALSTDGLCPACRTADQASKLRNNWQVQELANAFLAARPTTLKVAREHNKLIQNGTTRPGKRKREAIERHDEASAGGRQLRSKSRRVESSQANVYEEVEVDHDEEYSDDDTTVEQQPDDGLVECPLGCGRRMKVEQVEPHLDKCEDERKAREKADARAAAQAVEAKNRERLSELAYSMMKEKDLTRKMKELGVPVWGNKQLLTRRHTAWVNIWNANCDSSKPKSKRELLHDLDIWERTQGGSAGNQDQGLMRKDFDGVSWMNKNTDEFEKLIQNARRSKTKATAKIEADNTSIKQSEVPASSQSANGAFAVRRQSHNAQPQEEKESKGPAPHQMPAQLPSMNDDDLVGARLYVEQLSQPAAEQISQA